MSLVKPHLFLHPDQWIDVQTLLDLDEVADEFKKKKDF